MVKIDCEICCHIVASRQTIANFFLIFNIMLVDFLQKYPINLELCHLESLHF